MTTMGFRRTVHAVADFELALEGLEMDIARPRRDRLVEDEVDIFDDRGGVRLGEDSLVVDLLVWAFVNGDFASDAFENFADAGFL